MLTFAVSFAIVQATNVTLVYTIDAYRPVAGEVVVTQLAFKGKSKAQAFYSLSILTMLPGSCFWLSSVILHKSLDCKEWISRLIRSNGRYQCCYFDIVGAILFLWKANQTDYIQLGCDEVNPMERRSRSGRVDNKVQYARCNVCRRHAIRS